MSTLVGIAIAEGRLHLDDRLAHLLPRQAAAMTPRVARVTLRQLRTMTGGFLDTWDGTDEDQLDAASNWTRFILGHRDRAPARSSATPTRNRIINGPPRTASEIGWVLVASAALVLVFASLTMRRYRAKQ